MQREYPAHPIVAVAAVIIEANRVLVIKRAKEPSKGKWSIPGGMVELGETVREALKREAKEECGIEIEVLELVQVVDNIIYDESSRVKYHYILIGFLAGYETGRLKSASDISDAKWVERDELNDLDLTIGARKVIEKAWRIYEGL